MDSMLREAAGLAPADLARTDGRSIDAYFPADVETDGAIPGPYSMLSFALAYAGCFDGDRRQLELPADDN
jgi:hypothetical protein